MEGKMKVALMTELEKIEMVERNIPTISADELLIKVDYVGICGSDLHYYEHGRIGNFIVEFPFVLGHEVAGTVVEVGKNVTTHKVGDRVALEPQITNPDSEQAKIGKYNLDPEVEFFATPPIDGTFQEYVKHPAKLCFTLPENVSSLEGAMIEPLSVGIHAGFQANAHLGQTALITGCGCIGLVTILTLKAMGVSTVIATDLSENRLKKAKELGADYIINPKDTDVIEEINKLTDNVGIDLGMETSGSEIAARQLIELCKKGAKIVFVGYSPTGEMTLPIGMALDKELSFETVFRYRHTYPLAVKAIASGQIDIKKVVTNIFDFENIQDAMQEALKDKDNVVKGAIKVSK